jgi:hypothetical protein
MQQRQISEEELQAVLENPQWTTPAKSASGRGPRINLWRREKERLIRVTIAIDDEEVVSVVAPEEEGTLD